MTQPAKTFKDLIVGLKAHQFGLGVTNFPKNSPRKGDYSRHTASDLTA
jgi:hypothetical protein